ncbi:hypothetical protein TrRE_jg5016 [Triparma retinervis]|uniref:Uncharacterized protein n=1 Tax=Triparma retinervis TaxID=2557542 RepID=A0A9W7CGM8_9STRA|nr:hypothetical protein TrRE_jg5016 [Triparma retinervis]
MVNFNSPREGQIGLRHPEYEVGDLVLSRRARNAFGKFSLAKVESRRVVRGWTNSEDWTICQVAYYLSCGLCCARCAADSINERYLYTVKYLDTENPGVDKDFTANLLQTYTAEVEATDASCVAVGPGAAGASENDVVIVVGKTDS